MAVEAVDEQQTAWGKVAFRIDGLLEYSRIAARRLAALITTMENRVPRGPPDFEMGPRPHGIYVHYDGNTGPSPREPSWQTSLLGKIVAPLIVLGIPAILVALWTIKSDLLNLRGDNKVIVQRLDAQDKHLEATDRDVAEIKREIWPHKH